MDNINDFINIFNVTLTKKYELLKKSKKNKIKSELEQCLLWKEQEIGELKGINYVFSGSLYYYLFILSFNFCSFFFFFFLRKNTKIVVKYYTMLYYFKINLYQICMEAKIISLPVKGKMQNAYVGLFFYFLCCFFHIMKHRKLFFNFENYLS